MIELYFVHFFFNFLTADNQTRAMIALSFFLSALMCLVHSSHYNDYYAHENQGKSFGKLRVFSIMQKQSVRKFWSEVKWKGSFWFDLTGIKSGPLFPLHFEPRSKRNFPLRFDN